MEEPLRAANTTGTTASPKSFFSRILIRKNINRADDLNDLPKGPLGLTTLYAPAGSVVVDLVFVHGLNGGSQSTWCKGDASNFWPKEWLPNDKAFKDVRIHTFGYSSGISRESILNVQDFAASLMSAIQDSPTIPSCETVRNFLLMDLGKANSFRLP